MNNHHAPPQQPPLPPQPQPLCISPPPTTPNHDNNNPQFFLPFPPPTTPTYTPTTTTPRKKPRSKLVLTTTTTTTGEREPPLIKPKHHPMSSSNDEIIPPCTECGKIFWSKKALFGHMRCHPERPWRGIVPPCDRRRPLPPPPPTTDDQEVAASLLLLASSPSSSAQFQCSSCKKTFGSHQALGGHRASHKNVKGCFAIAKTSTDVEGDQCVYVHGVHSIINEECVGLGLSLGLGLGGGHKCGVCSKVYPTGQALGGHMRCHWEKTEASSSSCTGLGLGLISRPNNEAQHGFDLNLPGQLVDHDSPMHSSKNMQLDLRLGM